MEKLDLTRQYKSYYTAKTKPELVDIEAAQYLSVTGKGDPSSAMFAADVQALYTVGYAIKFMCKAMDKDFVVAKLEGLWWYDETQYKHVSMQDTATAIPRSEWHYQLLIRLPHYVNAAHVAIGIATAVDKKQVRRAKDVELYLTKAGKAVQMLHVGPFDREIETLQQIQAFMQANGLGRGGRHHEIYLSDFRKTAPERLKTILREPVAGTPQVDPERY